MQTFAVFIICDGRLETNKQTQKGSPSEKLGQHWLLRRQWSRAPGTKNSTDSGSTLRYGFQWIDPAATITVDLNLNDSLVTTFLELLYYT